MSCVNQQMHGKLHLSSTCIIELHSTIKCKPDDIQVSTICHLACCWWDCFGLNKRPDEQQKVLSLRCA